MRNSNFKVAGNDEYGDVYVLTNCRVNIEGVGPVDLKCAWDISYISEEVVFQSADNIPSEEYPDREDYINFHIRQSEIRTEQPIPM